MATEAQVAANRLNARKSTGPRTEAGKAKASQNAVRHGLLAEQVVIRGEDPGQFEFHRQAPLDAATQAEPTPEPASRTEEAPLRQTKPISPFSVPKTGFEGQGKAKRIARQGKRARFGGSESRPGHVRRPAGTGVGVSGGSQ